MKLALGTAQFGMNYGVTNKKGKTKYEEVQNILKYAFRNNLLTLDTSPAYGDSEKVLGNQELNNFSIITKLPYIDNLVVTKEEIIKADNTFKKSLVQLKKSEISGLLVHNAKDLQKKGSEQLYNLILSYKQKGIIEKIGVSVYSRQDIEDLYFNDYNFDMIQIPINIFDQRLDDMLLLTKLKKKGIEIHARSVFLQGTLLSDLEVLPSKFQMNNVVRQYYNDIEKFGINKIEASLGYISKLKFVDYAVIGVNDLIQLREINDVAEKLTTINKYPLDFKKYSISDLNIIDPRRW